MALFTFFAVLFSAFLHASWNVAGKKVARIITVPWFGFFIGGLLLSPVYIIKPPVVVDWQPVLFWTFISAVIHVVYVLTLFNAYEKWDVAVVYPVVRSTGVLICACASIFFFLDTLSPIGLIGIGFIIFGIIIKAIYRSFFVKGVHLQHLAVPMAVMVGCLVGSYLIVDRIAIQYLAPVYYIVLLNILMGVLLIPYMVLYRKPMIMEALRSYKRYIFVIGTCAMCSYLIILWVFTQTQFGYVTSLREVSIIFSAGLGYVVLKERIPGPQWVGILFLVLGAFLIKLAP